MKNKNLNNFFKEFLQNELDEMKKNQLRTIVLISLTFLSFFLLIFTNDNENKDNVTEHSQLEQIETKSKDSSKDQKSLNKKIIIVKKSDLKSASSSADSKEKNVSIVIGANPDNLCIRDPFISEENIKVNSKNKENKTSSIISESSLDSSKCIDQNLPDISYTPLPSDLPPIPTQYQKNNVTPPPQSINEFILVGTAIGINKNAIIKKVSPLYDQERNLEENIIVGIGDYVEGRKIIDIIDNALVFEDEKYLYASNTNDLDYFLSINNNDSDHYTYKENEIVENSLEEEIIIPKNNTLMTNEDNDIKPHTKESETVENNLTNILTSNENLIMTLNQNDNSKNLIQEGIYSDY